MFDNVLLLVFPAVMIFAAVMDLFTMTIPNRVSLALIAGFAMVAPLSGQSWETIGMHVLAGLVVLAISIFMFSRNWLGGGDAKLLAAASLWIGFDLLTLFVGVVGILGGALALALLAYRKFVPEIWIVKQQWAARLHKQNGGIPYGLAIAAGAIWIYPQTEWFAALVAMTS